MEESKIRKRVSGEYFKDVYMANKRLLCNVQVKN